MNNNIYKIKFFGGAATQVDSTQVSAGQIDNPFENTKTVITEEASKPEATTTTQEAQEEQPSIDNKQAEESEGKASTSIGGLKVDENLLNESASKLVMELVNVMVHKIIMQNQLIVNSQAEEFDKATENSPFIEQQLQARIELVNLISAANNELCKSLKEIFYTAGSTAFGIADKTFPIAVIIRLTQMITKIVNTGLKLNDKIEETLLKNSELANPEKLKKINDSFNLVEGKSNAVKQAAAKQATLSQKTAVPQAFKQQGGSPKKITNKKHIQSLKKKHLFNQKTLKIKNRLHKLLLR